MGEKNMAKKKTKAKKLEEAKTRAEKRAIRANAKLKAMEKLIDKGWKP
jgi:hypothetical protein